MSSSGMGWPHFAAELVQSAECTEATHSKHTKQRLIPLATVELEYNLVPREVSHLECRPVRKAASQTEHTKMYHREGVQKTAALKQRKEQSLAEQTRKQEALWLESHALETQFAAELKELKAQGARAANQVYRQECEAHIQTWNGRAIATLPYTSGTALPLEIWEKILKAVCADIEVEGVRGPSVVARDLANASMVSKELYGASLAAFRHLSSFCHPMQNGTDELWDEFVTDPTAMRLEDIKSLVKTASVKASQPRAALIVDLMNSLNLQRPSRIPAQLLKAIVHEKGTRFDTFSRLMYTKLHSLDIKRSEAENVFSLRLQLIKRGLLSMQHLDTAGIITKADIDKARTEKERRASIRTLISQKLPETNLQSQEESADGQ